MKDRQPTQVLSNGAIRYGIYNADGTLDHYEYMKRDDAPTVEGTPLNKANLLSDATAKKLWPGSTRPEDPTVNDAFAKLSTGMHRVGDIDITSRDAPSAAWLPCDGRYVSQADYPELFDVLRTTASQGDWSTQIVNADILAGKKGDVVSYANGVWFRSRSENTLAGGEYYTETRMWYSLDNMQSWYETTVLNNIVAINSVHFYAQEYICLCLVEASAASYRTYVYHASQPSGPWNLAANIEERSSQLAAEDFTRDIITDGARYYIVGNYHEYGDYELYYSDNPLASAWSVSEHFGTGRNPSGTTYVNAVANIRYNEGDGYFYGAKGTLDAGGKVIARTKTPTTYSSWQQIYSVTGYYWGLCVAGSTIVAFGVGTSQSTYAYSTDGGSTFKQGTISKTPTMVGHCVVLGIHDGIVVVAASDANNTNPVILYSDDMDTGFISTATPERVMSLAGNDSGLIVGALMCDGSETQNVYRDFAYDSKKVPKITPDSRSHAYIKALEE